MWLSLARQRAIVVLLPALITLVRFRNRLVFDDVFVIQRSDFIHHLKNLPRVFSAHTMVASSLDAVVGKPGMDTYRPLSLASFFLDAAISHRQPWAYHATNLLLHCAVCGLLLELLRRRQPDSYVPLLVTLLFALAPWLAEAHVWINGRSDLWLTLFVLLALLARAPWLTGLAMLGALASKELAVCALPFVVLAPDERSVRERVLRAWPTYLALLLYLGARAWALDGLRTHEDLGQLLAALRNLPLLLADGLLHLVVPSPYALRNMRDDYAALPTWLGPTLALVELLALAWLLRTRRTYSLWALGLALATLAPAAMVSTALWPGFGRYLYLPAVGCACLLADLASATRLPPRLLAVAAITLIAASGALLFDATLSLRDEPTTYTRALARAPTQAWTMGFLGLSRKRDGHCDEAVPLLTVADSLAPEESRYAVHLARCLIDLEQTDEARAVARRGQARFAGTRAESGFLVAELLTTLDPVRARELIQRCLAVAPNRPDCAEALQRLRALERKR
jgi:hypothetical protein